MTKTNTSLDDKNQSKDTPTSDKWLIWKLFAKTTVLALVFTLVLLVLTGVVMAVIGWSKFLKFSKAAEVNPREFISEIKAGYESEPTLSEGRKNLLVLGLDSLENRGDAPELTDTMILFSIDTKTGKMRSISLPRDLWSPEYQTKINALYHYGKERYPDDPKKFPTEVVSDLTNVSIHHTIVLTLEQLEEIIDLVGGVTVSIEEGFIDEAFPRTDVDVTVETDPEVLYETITFQEGEELMSGERALKFIRSRHSEGDQGTDISRGKRQQAVIKALFTELINPKKMWSDPTFTAALFSYYKDQFEESLPLQELLALARSLYPVKNSIEYIPGEISISLSDDSTDAVIVHPDPSPKYQNQWVYSIPDNDLFVQELNEQLY